MTLTLLAPALVSSGCSTSGPKSSASSITLVDLQKLADAVRSRTGAPGLAVAVVRSAGAPVIAVAGVRDVSATMAVEPADVFEIGSLTKSMTATALARLVDDGRLTWDRRIGDVFSGTPMRDEYRSATVAMLLRHRTGLSPMQSVDPEMERELDELKGTATEQRASLVRWLLQRPPAFAPGTAYAYSNGDYVTAGAIGEKVSGLAFDALLAREVFEPLHMASARVGGERRSDEVRGHVMVDGRLQPVPIHDNPYDLPPAFEPAGAVRSSIGDLIGYAQNHLRALRGLAGVLTAAAAAELHRPEPGPTQVVEPFGKPVGYAGGWLELTFPNHHRVSWHNGSAGSFFAWLTIAPDDDVAIAVLTNVGGRDPGERACRETTAGVLERLAVK
ncbi:MAG TPA: serine hydrolase domain-containing protein [Vicinamibacterales bacterium]